MLFSPNRLLTTKEQLLLVGVLFALVAGAGALFWHGRHAGEQRVETADTSRETAPPPAAPAVPASPTPVDAPMPGIPVVSPPA